MNKKFLRLFVAFLGLFSLLAWTNPVDFNFENSHLDEQEAIIRERIPSVVTIVNPIYTPAVRSYLNTYIYRRPSQTAYMLGWAKYYFPKFEKALEEAGLPTDLKYLAIVESALNPNAISRAGAGGLWQFMKPTAKECGLKCGTYVDERMDPEKSTKAAVQYLKTLYGMFGNWELVMAAYNAGPGRVRGAVKRAGSNDYWKVSKYLPVETRAYVPGFIAASYLMNFYNEHNIIPIDPAHALGELVPIVMNKGMHLSELAKRSGLTVEIVKTLNPCFIKNYIPASQNGYTIWLPAASAELFNSGRTMETPEIRVAENIAENMFVDANTKKVVISGELYHVSTIKKYYTVRSGDNLYDLARRNNCTVKEIMSWNRLHNSRLAIGQKLEFRKILRELVPIIVEPIQPPPPVRLNHTLTTLPSLLVESLPLENKVQKIAFGIDPNLPAQTDNSIVLKRRQCIRQALGGVQLSSGISTSQIVMPKTVVTGDVVKWRSRT